jgi:hypothetical protein
MAPRCRRAPAAEATLPEKSAAVKTRGLSGHTFEVFDVRGDFPNALSID